MTGGCGRLLSTEDHTHARAHTHKHTQTPLMPPLLSSSLSALVSLSLSLSLCENCRVLTMCSGVWCGLCSASGRACEGS